MSSFDRVEMDGIIDFPEVAIKGVYDGLGLSEVIFDFRKYTKAEKQVYLNAFFQSVYAGFHPVNVNKNCAFGNIMRMLSMRSGFKEPRYNSQAFFEGLRDMFNPEYIRELRQDDYDNLKSSIENIARIKGFYPDEIIQGHGFIESKIITMKNTRFENRKK